MLHYLGSDDAVVRLGAPSPESKASEGLQRYKYTGKMYVESCSRRVRVASVMRDKGTRRFSWRAPLVRTRQSLLPNQTLQTVEATDENSHTRARGKHPGRQPPSLHGSPNPCVLCLPLQGGIVVCESRLSMQLRSSSTMAVRCIVRHTVNETVPVQRDSMR